MAETGRHDKRHDPRYEQYEGGSPEAERLVFDRLAQEIMKVQVKNRRPGGGGINRAIHAKAPLGVENARLRFHDDLPAALRVGFARPGADYPVTLRLSNASGVRQGDGAPDLRGAARPCAYGSPTRRATICSPPAIRCRTPATHGSSWPSPRRWRAPATRSRKRSGSS